ncbi:MAG TPA: hypothetical protein VME01_03875 [Solirubrobacteraceae bacterium]|nr:hypothetical protein [Solirubrobacteraceae bacterium]
MTRSWRWLALAVGGLLALVLLIAPARAAARAPAGFQPTAFTAISDSSWWVLGSSPCGKQRCAAIVRSEDGGRTFTAVAAPPLRAPEGGPEDQIRFADASNGYLFGSQLWVTHDGARTWQRVNLGGSVASLEPGIGYVYAIVDHAGSSRLVRAPIGSDDWTTIYTPAKESFLESVWVHGDDVLVNREGPRALWLLVSHNQGASFAAYKAPPAVACFPQEQSQGTIWLPCATGMMSGIWRSTDGGRTFAAAGGDASRPSRSVPLMPNSMAFGSASDDVAVAGFQRLYRTTNGGQSYAPIKLPSVTEWMYIGFTDASHGVAIAQLRSGQSRLYHTTDAGASYQYIPISA